MKFERTTIPDSTRRRSDYDDAVDALMQGAEAVQIERPEGSTLKQVVGCIRYAAQRVGEQVETRKDRNLDCLFVWLRKEATLAQTTEGYSLKEGRDPLRNQSFAEGVDA